jgi:hypothetical protein
VFEPISAGHITEGRTNPKTPDDDSGLEIGCGGSQPTLSAALASGSLNLSLPPTPQINDFRPSMKSSHS